LHTLDELVPDLAIVRDNCHVAQLHDTEELEMNSGTAGIEIVLGGATELLGASQGCPRVGSFEGDNPFLAEDSLAGPSADDALELE
jgi:hypothetical protein